MDNVRPRAYSLNFSPVGLIFLVDYKEFESGYKFSGLADYSVGIGFDSFWSKGGDICFVKLCRAL